METCIYQSVQCVMDLMDACQCSQMRIQLKICITNQKDKYSNSDSSIRDHTSIYIAHERDLLASSTKEVRYSSSNFGQISSLMRKSTTK